MLRFKHSLCLETQPIWAFFSSLLGKRPTDFAAQISLSKEHLQAPHNVRVVSSLLHVSDHFQCGLFSLVVLVFHSPTPAQLNSTSVMVFKSSLGHLSGPDTFPGFRQCSTYFFISSLLSAPRNLPSVSFAVLKQSIPRSVKCCNFPIAPLQSWKSVNCQYCWQKATNSRLLCSTVH